MWSASVFGQKMSEGRRKDDEEMKEKKRFLSLNKYFTTFMQFHFLRLAR